MSNKIGRVARAAQRPEHEAVKQTLLAAARLRAIGVTPRMGQQFFNGDSWAKEQTDDAVHRGLRPDRPAPG